MSEKFSRAACAAVLPLTDSAPHPDLLPWALSVLGDSQVPALTAVAGDASARRYFRLSFTGESFIAVESPPASEKNAQFLAMRDVLESAGLCVPGLVAADLERGFLLLGDLGDRLLLAELAADTVDERYCEAFDVLQRLGAADPADPDWPQYDEALLREELSRFPQWFAGRLLGTEVPSEAGWDALVRCLVDSALEQPRVLVHRDFHSRNLMPQANGALGVIDFQDAVIGPVTYDLVSLLRDCYVRWPPQQVQSWALAYLERLRKAQLDTEITAARFLRWFDLMGLQRHLKVLGTFARLYLRDGKPAYLDDLPLVLRYVSEVLDAYRDSIPEVKPFAHWFESALVPAVAAQDWSQGR